MPERVDAELSRDLDGVVPAGVVGENDVVDNVVRNFGVGAPQSPAGVIRRQDDGYSLAKQHVGVLPRAR